jgi:hypothetical protein
VPAPDTDDVYFVFNTTDVGTMGRGIQVLAWDALYDSVPLRGGGEIMPGAAGRRRFELTPDDREVTLFLQFNGQWNADGTRSTGDPRAVVSLALRTFEASLNCGQLGQDFEWHDYGIALAGGVQYLGLQGTRFAASHIVNTSLDLILPPTLEEIGS